MEVGESYAVYGRAADSVARAWGQGALPELSAREGGIGVFMRRERSHEGTHPRYGGIFSAMQYDQE